MATTTATQPTPSTVETIDDRPMLLLFASRTSGVARRVEGYLAYVLQRRHNHDTFRRRIVLKEERPDLFERLHVTTVPTVLVVDEGKVQRRLQGSVRPHQIEETLADWLH